VVKAAAAAAGRTSSGGHRSAVSACGRRDLGVAVGRLRRDAADRLDAPDFEAWVECECGCDARAAAAMKSWLVKVGEVAPGHGPARAGPPPDGYPGPRPPREKGIA
jgi:hypothetical protein